jgi:hypothetical protein
MRITGKKRTKSIKARQNTNKTHRFTNIQKHKRPRCHKPETQKEDHTIQQQPHK